MRYPWLAVGKEVEFELDESWRGRFRIVELRNDGRLDLMAVARTGPSEWNGMAVPEAAGALFLADDLFFKKAPNFGAVPGEVWPKEAGAPLTMGDGWRALIRQWD